ncbi:VTT domain-containing protein [Vibrio sp. M250220]|uniref:DedA family protein n=1 Tax=Vibrio sp. M250220 TaxID=3020894 RepID=UPI002F40D66E
MTDISKAVEVWLLQGNLSLLALFLGIVLLSYLLEDLAIVTAASLAVEQALPTSIALLAVFAGISSGDLGLYMIGKMAQRVRFLRYRLFRYQRTRSLRHILHRRAFMTLFLVRFIPGLRTIGFTLSGFLGVAKTTFLFAVLTATALWTVLIFGAFFQLGNAQWFQQHQSGWVLIPLGGFLMVLVNKLLTKTLLRDTYDRAR